MIDVRTLSKSYRVHRRAAGLLPAARSLFHRVYDEVRAVDAITFHIEPGERVGFLGPNGAGKTTTLKMLSGLLHPSGGQANVLGFIPFERAPEFLSQITLVMGQKQQLLWDLPPAETFAINKAIYQISDALFKETLDELTDLLQLADLVVKPTRQLSLGERMKCELAAALLHRPKVLFLDEPTIGLDVAMQATMRTFVKAYNERFGATVLLTSHYMDDVVALCPRVIVIDRGRLIYDGALDELIHKVRPEKRISLRFGKPVERIDIERFGNVVAHAGAQATLQVEQANLQPAVSGLLAALPVVDLTVEDPPLEEVMRELFQAQPGRVETKS
jgi:ABC-2 type transport system ATP-binding protein